MTVRRAGFFLFAAVSIVLTLWIAAELSGFDRSGPRNDHQATFADATGVRTGDAVRVSGVPVGEVTGIEVDAGRAIVRFAVDEDIPLPVDSEVAVRSKNMIGLRELIVAPGSSDQLLEDGDEMEQTSSAVDLGALINELGPLLETASPAQVNELVSSLNQTLSGNRETIANLTGDFAVVLDSMASRAGTIDQLLRDYATLSDEVADRDQQIQRLLDNLLLLTETFDASEGVLQAALRELPVFTDELDSLLDANATVLDGLVRDLTELMSHVGANAATIGAALEGIPGSASSLFDVAGRGEALTANFACMALSGPPCPHPPFDGPSLEAVLQELLGP